MPKHLHDLSAPPADAKKFDAFFYRLPKAEQQKWRDLGILPYREAVKPRHVFEVDPNSRQWAEDGEGASLLSSHLTERTETEAFISRAHVGRMLRGFIDALSLTGDFKLRRHVELVRWSLGMPGRLPATSIARMYGITKQAVHKRARTIREAISPDALGRFRSRKRRVK